MTRSVCPVCGKEQSEGDKDVSPFCSERCRTIDLGRWLSERYRIATETPSGADEWVSGANPGSGQGGEARADADQGTGA